MFLQIQSYLKAIRPKMYFQIAPKAQAEEAIHMTFVDDLSETLSEDINQYYMDIIKT